MSLNVFSTIYFTLRFIFVKITFTYNHIKAHISREMVILEVLDSMLNFSEKFYTPIR